MTDAPNSKGQRDRSPAYPSIPLGAAIERLISFEAYFKRHPAPLDKMGLAWNVAAKGSQADQIASALKQFGFIESEGVKGARQAVLSDDGRTYLRANQDAIKQEILRRAALRPKSIATMWNLWGADRPPDPVALDTLTMKHDFSDRGAPLFLKVYDATIDYAGLSGSDKVQANDGEWGAEDQSGEAEAEIQPKSGLILSKTPPAAASQGKVKVMDGERVAFTEEGQPGQYLKLIASGDVDDSMLEALEDFVKRQRKRLAAPKAPIEN
jgi:hypothetical protein